MVWLALIVLTTLLYHNTSSDAHLIRRPNRAPGSKCSNSTQKIDYDPRNWLPLTFTNSKAAMRELNNLLDESIHAPDPLVLDWTRQGCGSVLFPKESGRKRESIHSWAYALTGVLEAQQNSGRIDIKNQDRRNQPHGIHPLSEQQLIDCVGPQNCNLPFSTLEALVKLRNYGIQVQTEESYYKPDHQFCGNHRQKGLVQVRDLIKLPSDQETVLAKVVARYGPVAARMVSLGLDENMNQDSAEVECRIKSTDIDVLVVGYSAHSWKIVSSLKISHLIAHLSSALYHNTDDSTSLNSSREPKITWSRFRVASIIAKLLQ